MSGADRDGAATLADTLRSARARLQALGRAPRRPRKFIADKGYHGREVLNELDGGGWTGRIAEERRPEVGCRREHHAARRAVGTNRARLPCEVAKAALRLRAEICERSFAPALDHGARRRTGLPGRANVHKRSVLNVAGYNLGSIVRRLTGHGTPREAAALHAASVGIAFLTDGALIIILVVIALSNDDAQSPLFIAFVGVHG